MENIYQLKAFGKASHKVAGGARCKVLSPLLYNIYTYDLEIAVNSFCKTLQYADDLALYVSSKSITEAAVRLNSALYYLNIFLAEHGLSLAVAKSRTIVFSRRYNIPQMVLVCNNQQIPNELNVKFLGAILDSRMTGASHFSYIAQKCEKGVNILRALSGVWWGSHPYCQKLLYNAIVRSHLDYAAFIFEPCNRMGLEKLNLIQAKCMRIILGAMKSSPNIALQVECADPPLDLRRQYLSDRFIGRIIQISSHPLLPLLQRLSVKVTNDSYWSQKAPPRAISSYKKYINLQHPIYQNSKFPIFEINYDTLIFRPNIILDSGINKGDITANAKFLNLLERWDNWLTMYTDASKLNVQSEVGAAVWIPKFNIVLGFKCPPQATVFTGEAVAILEAVSYIESHSLNKVLIFSDSKSCLDAILGNFFKKNEIQNSALILKIKEKLFNCHIKGLEVIIIWIPGHSGISGNELADRWARSAAESGPVVHSINYSRDIVLNAKHDLLNSWNERWNVKDLHKARQYRSIQPTIPQKPWFFKHMKACKWVTSTICRLRLGHSCTPVHLAKIKVRDHSLCECGLDEGTLDHVFFSCKKFPSSLYDILPTKIPRPTNFQFLLSFPDPCIINILCKYIKMYSIKL